MKGFFKKYKLDLHDFLLNSSEASLKSAEILGQEAVVLGLKMVDVAVFHEHAMIAEILAMKTDIARKCISERAKLYISAVLLPIEANYRAAFEALDSTLHANKALVKEVELRKLAEKKLLENDKKTSELLKNSVLQQKRLRKMARLLLSAQEDERKRVSRDLHDVIAQVLTGINVQLSVLKLEALSNFKGISRNIARAEKLVAKSVDIVHRFAFDLRPVLLDDLGLIPALQLLIQQFSKDSSLSVKQTFSFKEDIVNKSCRTVLYRVVQEALRNVARHAAATEVSVNIVQVDNVLRLEVVDNGKSFDAEAFQKAGKSKRIGLFCMRERVEMVEGHFSIHSSPGQGTTVRAEFPWQNDDETKSSLQI